MPPNYVTIRKINEIHNQRCFCSRFHRMTGGPLCLGRYYVIHYWQDSVHCGCWYQCWIKSGIRYESISQNLQLFRIHFKLRFSFIIQLRLIFPRFLISLLCLTTILTNFIITSSNFGSPDSLCIFRNKSFDSSRSQLSTRPRIWSSLKKYWLAICISNYSISLSQQLRYVWTVVN